ncbi:MAG TPA: hypothetical protein PKH10_04765 [bacterium]|nr:hypothetical protein [bacterium]
MKNPILFMPLLAALFLFVSCAGADAPGGGAALTTEDIAGIWEAGPREFTKTCQGDDEIEEGEGSYLSIVALDATQVVIDLCYDRDCAEMEDDPRTLPFQGNRAVYGPPGVYLVYDTPDCEIYMEIFRYDISFSSASTAVHRQHFKIMYEGTRCEDEEGVKLEDCETEFSSDMWKIHG